MRNEVAIDQPKTGMKVAVEIGEAAIGSVAMEAATAAEAAKTSTTETSSAVMVATAVAASVAAAVIPSLQAG